MQRSFDDPSDRLSVFAAASELPDQDALVWHETVYSYRTLAERVAAQCASLRSEGVSCGQRVAVRAENHPDVVVTLLALIELDATAVLLHPKLTETEVRTLLDDAAPQHTLLDRSRMQAVVQGGTTQPTQHDPKAIMAMLYTSGTTGKPKGAMLSRAAFVASAQASADNLGWRDDDRWLLCLPVCHVGGLSVLTRALLARRCVVLHPRFDAEPVLRSLRHDRVTLLSVVPTMLRALLDADGDGVLASLRAVLVGGAATARTLLERCVERRVRVLTTYGLTEACSQVTTQCPTDTWTVRDDSGRVLGATELEVRTATGDRAAIGEVGHIVLRGASVMTGYWRHPPLGDAWLDTGDLGSFDAERNLHVHARRTDLIVTGGENVYPVEVEHEIARCDGVAAVAVFGVADERWGACVAAAIVRDKRIDTRGDTPWLVWLGAMLRTRLASHKLPRFVAVVEALPMRATGKVDRVALMRDVAPCLVAWPV